MARADPARFDRFPRITRRNQRRERAVDEPRERVALEDRLENARALGVVGREVVGEHARDRREKPAASSAASWRVSGSAPRNSGTSTWRLIASETSGPTSRASAGAEAARARPRCAARDRSRARRTRSAPERAGPRPVVSTSVGRQLAERAAAALDLERSPSALRRSRRSAPGRPKRGAPGARNTPRSRRRRMSASSSARSKRRRARADHGEDRADAAAREVARRAARAARGARARPGRRSPSPPRRRARARDVCSRARRRARPRSRGPPRRSAGAPRRSAPPPSGGARRAGRVDLRGLGRQYGREQLEQAQAQRADPVDELVGRARAERRELREAQRVAQQRELASGRKRGSFASRRASAISPRRNGRNSSRKIRASTLFTFARLRLAARGLRPLASAYWSRYSERP